MNEMRRITFVQGIQPLKIYLHLICNRNVLGIRILEFMLRNYKPKSIVYYTQAKGNMRKEKVNEIRTFSRNSMAKD